MPNISINVISSTGQSFQIDLADSETTTVQELKQRIGEKMGHADASSLILKFSDKILNNEDRVNDCKITAGSTVHVKAPTAPTANNATTSFSSTSSPARQTTLNPIPTIPPTPSPSTLTGLGGNPSSSASASPFGDMQMPNMDPEVMRQMMDSPFMQNIMGNTDFVRSMIMSNPQMKALVEQNPELGHVISDPAFLRQSMEMMRNPELMREMQRNNDRALSNIEAIPGGFNHLRRMYNTLQSPMESALAPGGGASSDEANERLARELNVESVPENSLNTQALPNPWAARANNQSGSNSNTNTTAAATAAAANPFAALSGSGAGNPLAALLGGSGGSMFPFGGETQRQPQQQQPQPQPQPQAQAQAQSTQQQQQTPFWADPNFIQTSMRMQQAMMAGQQPQNNNNNTTDSNQQQQNLIQQMLMGFPSGGFGGASNVQPQLPSEPPEIRFRDQLAQLEEMGFSVKASNVRALLATGGNVQAAIEYLLSM